jgi:hypothetical protein
MVNIALKGKKEPNPQPAFLFYNLIRRAGKVLITPSPRGRGPIYPQPVFLFKNLCYN